MKRLTCIAASLALLISLISFTGCNNNRADILKIYNTADYIALGDSETKGVISLFEDYYRQKTGNPGFKVVYETFDTNEVVLTKIIKNKEDWDLVNISDYAVERLINENLLNKIDISTENMPNYANVSDYIKNQYSQITGLDSLNGGETYAVGYMWGTMGILYNTAAGENIAEDVKSWDALWNSTYKDKVLMKNSVRDSYAAALLYSCKNELLNLKDSPAQQLSYIDSLLGVADSERISIASEALLNQKELVNVRYEVDDGKDDIATGRGFMMSLAWSGDAAYAISEAAEGVKLGYSIPDEGSNVWFDGWVTPVYGKNREAAAEFINFLCNPDIAIMNMEETGYTSVVADGEGKVLDWYLEDAQESGLGESIDASYFFGEDGAGIIINPVYISDVNDISRCGIMRDFGDKTDDVLTMWVNVKGAQVSAYVYVILIAVAALISAAVIFTVLKRNKKNKKRIIR